MMIKNNIILRNFPVSFSLQKLVIKNNTTTLVPVLKLCLSLVVYRLFSSGKSISSKLHPGFVTGFADAEGCFYLKIIKKTCSTRWISELNFQITLHKKDRPLLELIKLFFGIGSIINLRKDYILYRVSSKKDLAVIIDHFDKYPLLTQKRADYELFKQAFNLISNKEHLTPEGLKKLVGIKASINLGLSDELKASFTDVIPVKRPLVKDQNIRPHWLAGFTSGDGNLFAEIYKSKTRTGFNVTLSLRISQHSRDVELLNNIIIYLDCGRVIFATEGDCRFVVTKFSDIETKIIPFFDKYNIEGVKALDYEDLKKIVEIMKVKGHLTEEGLKAIRELKAGMNTGRLISV